MKQIVLIFSFISVFLISQGCQSGSESNSDESSGVFAKKPANEFAKIEDGPVYSFTVVPDQYKNCKAVFSQSEDELASETFIFASDLSKSCVLAIDGRLIQVELRNKQTVNPTSQFYKFEGNGYMIDLEIRQTEQVGHDLQKARGQLKVFSQSGFRDIFYIMGEIKC